MEKQISLLCVGCPKECPQYLEAGELFNEEKCLLINVQEEE